ncbi:MAG: MFS transporter [Candidatus Sericytochromatia bacterium]
MPERIFNTLLGLSFLHGVFASGLIPILNRQLGTEASWAFAAYFLAQLAGQVLVWRWGALSRWRGLFTVYELLFGASFLLMAVMPSTWLATGRGLEGLAAGLVLPLIFAHLARLPVQLPVAQRIVRYNGSFAGGYVLGPLLVELALQGLSHRLCLLAFGGGLIALNLWLGPQLPALPQADENSLRLRQLFAGQDWFARFYSLFYAKCFYGFMLAFVTAYAGRYFASWPLSAITLSLACLFVAGQQIGARLEPRLHRRGLEILLPLGIGLTLFAMGLTGWGGLLYLAALQHALLLFLALLGFSLNMESGRAFALFNSLSDPGMVLGAVLASFGTSALGVMLLLGLLPLLYWRQWPRLFKPVTTIPVNLKTD